MSNLANLAGNVIVLEKITVLTQRHPWFNKPEILGKLNEHFPYADQMLNAFGVLAGNNMDSEANFNLLTQHPQHSCHIGAAFCQLHRAKTPIDTQENFNLLAQHAAFADSIATVFYILRDTYPHQLDTQENFISLVQYAPFITPLGPLINRLRAATPKLDTQANLTALFECHKFLDKILSELRGRPLSQSIFDALMDKVLAPEREKMLTDVLGLTDWGLFGRTQATPPSVAPLANIICDYLRVI